MSEWIRDHCSEWMLFVTGGWSLASGGKWFELYGHGGCSDSRVGVVLPRWGLARSQSPIGGSAERSLTDALRPRHRHYTTTGPLERPVHVALLVRRYRIQERSRTQPFLFPVLSVPAEICQSIRSAISVVLFVSVVGRLS